MGDIGKTGHAGLLGGWSRPIWQDPVTPYADRCPPDAVRLSAGEPAAAARRSAPRGTTDRHPSPTLHDSRPHFVAPPWPDRRRPPTMAALLHHDPRPTMTHAFALGSLSPVIIVHLTLASAALVLGPLALTARKGSRLHRAAGYAWVTLMIGAALSSVFIRDFQLPNLAGYTPIHLLTVLTFAGVGSALLAIARRRIAAHRRAMWSAYLGGCIGAGLFALLPGRYLGDLLWHHALGWV
jgi:uncharacterized membrane protein